MVNAIYKQGDKRKMIISIILLILVSFLMAVSEKLEEKEND